MANFNNQPEKVSVIVREFEGKYVYEIPIQEWRAAENKSGHQSAFAESRAVLKNGLVEGTEMKVGEYLRYRN